MSTARLEIVVGSGGVMSADKALKQLTATAKETEKQQQRMATVIAEIAASEEKAAAKAIAAAEKKVAADAKAADRAAMSANKQAVAAEKAAEREAAAWNDAKQKAIARHEKQVEAAERAANRQVAVTERAAKREEEAWTRAIQRAKAGLDGVLPIRPSLQRIEAELASKRDMSAASPASGLLAGGKEGALSALGLGALAGGAATVAAASITALASSIKSLKSEVINDFVEDERLVAQLGGVTDSAQAANEAFSDLERQTLGKLPSTVNEVATAFIQLSNNGLNSGQTALKAYSNIAAQTGASLGTVTNAVQMATLGNYRSLREFGIRVKEEGDSLKVTFRGQTETIASGADSIQEYMQRLGNVQFAGAVERQMDTVGGSIKKADDAWEKLINAVGASSIGDVIKSSVGASVSIIDAATASIDALFGKTMQFSREAESLKRKRAEEDELDRTMRGWADPTASKSETARLATVIAENSQSSADKALAQYTRNSALIDKLRMLGETRVGDLTLDAAQSELDRQYMRDNGGNGKAKVATKSRETIGDFDYRMARDENVAIRQSREWTARDTADEEQWFTSAIEHEAKLSALEVKRQDNEQKLADERVRKQIELQRKLAGIGIGPQSQVQQAHAKTAGAYYELGNALGENLRGKNGETLKLEAEETYKEKSIAIERERAREITVINQALVEQSMQNSATLFGNLAQVAKNAGGENSAAYQRMFAIQKGFALASGTLAMYQSIAKGVEKGWPEGIPFVVAGAAQGAAVLAQITATSYAGAYDSGGDVPARSRALGGERGVEIVGPAGVLGREQTAALLSGQRNTRIIFTTDEDRGFLGSTRDERVLVHWIKRNGTLIKSVVA